MSTHGLTDDVEKNLLCSITGTFSNRYKYIGFLNYIQLYTYSKIHLNIPISGCSGFIGCT